MVCLKSCPHTKNYNYNHSYNNNDVSIHADEQYRSVQWWRAHTVHSRKMDIDGLLLLYVEEVEKKQTEA